MTPRTPDAHPSGWPLPPRPAWTKIPAPGASGKQQDRTQPTPGGSGQGSTSNQGGQLSPPVRVERLLPPGRVESYPLPDRAVNRPPQAEVGYQQPWEVLLTLPQVGEEWVIVPGLTGTKWSCARLGVESLSPMGFPIWLGWRRRGKRPSVRFMTE